MEENTAQEGMLASGLCPVDLQQLQRVLTLGSQRGDFGDLKGL